MSSTAYVAASHARWLAAEPSRAWRELPATLVFADVSGFTAMSEKLARRGTIGAEETTAAINRVFAGMLSATTQQGGEILKFGGDAVLTLFAGAEHERRGAAAALAMQDFMRGVRRLQTAAGPVQLRLSVGVASGTALLVLAGTQPADLLVVGPLADAVVAHESAANGGQVVASAATLAALPARCAGAAVGPGRLLRAVPPGPAVAPPAPPAGFDPRPGLPAHLHDREPADGEHRFASVAFVSFRGTNALGDRPDALSSALHGLLVATGNACATHGVTLVSTDVDADGGKVILAAGAPAASPDDEDRLVQAVRRILAVPTPLRVRAGVHRGRVFCGDIGTDLRRVWSVMGDAVNLAARVMGHAEPGTLLATPSVVERLRDDYERTPVPPFLVKGKTQPVFAEVVGEARATRRATTGRLAPLVGREAELEAIQAALEDARAGRHTVLELVGEPGIGKSRLVEAAIAAGEDLALIRVAGGPYAAHSPYRALHGPLRELLGLAHGVGDAETAAALIARTEAVAPHLADWLPLIGVPFGLDLPPTPETALLEPEFARDRMNVLTGRLIAFLLAERPALLVAEDTHWLDEASGVLLGHLARRGRDHAGHLVLATRRDEGSCPFAAAEPRTLRLAPLDAGAATALLAGGEGSVTLPPGAAATLVERSGGNPLLLQELVAAAAAGQPLDTLPDSVEGLVMSRIDGLSQADRGLLLQAAVLGVQVTTDLLRDVLGLAAEELAAALVRLDGFLVPDGPGRVRFRHALLRDAAYQALSHRRRRELHARLAALIEARDDAQAELLAIHFHAAGAWRETWHYARLAAEMAFEHAAPIEALGFMARALDAARALRALPAREIAHAYERQGDAAVRAGRPDDAIRAYAAARRHLRDDPLACANLFHRQGRVLDGYRSVARALAAFTRGLTALDAAPPGEAADRLRAQLVLDHGAARVRGGRLREALPYLDEAVALAERSGDRSSLAHAFYVLESVHNDLGSPDALRYRGRALPIFEALGDHGACARVLINDGATAYLDGRWEDAITCYQRAADANLRVGDVTEAALTQANIAELRCDQGHLAEAADLLREALVTWRSAGFGLGVGFALSNLGRVALRRGDHDEAATLLDQAAEHLEAVGAASHLLEVRARRAELALAVGEPAEALALAGAVRARAKELGASPNLLSGLQRLAGEAKVRLGDPEGARERFAEALSLAREAGARYEEGCALAGLGDLGDAEAAEAGRQVLTDLGVVTALV